MFWDDYNWLTTALVFTPLVGVLIMMAIPAKDEESHKTVALITTLVTAGLGVVMWRQFDFGQANVLQFEYNRSWIEVVNANYKVGIDGMSLPLIALTLLVVPLVIIYSWNHIPSPGNTKMFLMLTLVLHTGMLGSFVAQDLVLFFVFFEIVLLPMYFMIGVWGGEDRLYAAIKFFLFTLFGSALMLVAFLALYWNTGSSTFDMVKLAEEVASRDIPLTTQVLIFGGMFLGFGIKVPLFPFHTWLPDAHTQAPTQGSVILAAVLLKLGTYGFLRFGLYLFPEAAVWSRSLWLTLAVIGIIYGAIAATMQKDLKRLVAYSSIAHLGFIILGTFAFTTQAISGSVLQMVNHGVSTGALFLLVGMIYERRKTRQIAELGGLQKVAPIFAAGFMIVMLSSIGVPGLNGFIGEYLILIGSFQTARWWTVVATAGVILAALYLLWAYQRVFHGEPDEANQTFPELKAKEAMVLLPFIVAIVFTGVYPKPLLDRIEPSVERLVTHVADNTDVETDPSYTTQRGEFENEHSEGGDAEGEEETHSEEEGEG